MLSLSRSCHRHVLSSSSKQRIYNSINSINSQIQIHSYTTFKDEHQSEKNKSDALFATGVGAAVNFGLAVSKGGIGYSIGSTALLADCFNSMGDLVADAVVYFSVTEARKKATPDKPWGSGKIEPLGAFVVGSALAATGVGIAYSASATMFSMYNTVEVVTNMGSVADLASLQAPQLAALGVAGISIFLKEALFHYTLKAGQKANSDAIIANAWQHRSDVFVSISVFCGLTGSFAGMPILDPLAGLLVSGVILKQAATICTKAYKDLSDSPATEEETQALRKTCLLVPGIKSVVDMKARQSGPYVFVECTVGIRGDVSASTAHRLGELVKNELLRRYSGRVANVIVNLDPLGSTGLGERASSSSRSHEAITVKVKQVLLEPQRRPLVRPIVIPSDHPNPDVFEGRPVSKSTQPINSNNSEDLNFNNIRHISSVSEVIVYYKDDGSLSLKVDVCMNPDLTIRQAHKIAVLARVHLMEAIEGVTQVDVDLELDETFVDEVTSSSTITGSEKENIGSTKFKMSPASTPNQPTSNPDDTFGNKK